MLNRIVGWMLLATVSVVASIIVAQTVVPTMEDGLTRLSNATSLVP